VSAKIEQIVNSRMRTQKTLGLTRRFKAAHAALSYPGWFMWLLGSIIRILWRVVDSFRDKFPTSDTVASQLIRAANYPIEKWNLRYIADYSAENEALSAQAARLIITS